MRDQRNESDFKPVSFSNARTQDFFIRGGLKPDPEDIDGRSSQKEHVSDRNGTQIPELDGINKYLMGVKVPQGINPASSYTLKNLREDEKTLNFQREE